MINKLVEAAKAYFHSTRVASTGKAFPNAYPLPPAFKWEELMAILALAVPKFDVSLPEYCDIIDATAERDLNPIEEFIINHEPAGPDEEQFRADLARLIAYVKTPSRIPAGYLVTARDGREFYFGSPVRAEGHQCQPLYLGGDPVRAAAQELLNCFDDAAYGSVRAAIEQLRSTLGEPERE